MNLIRLKSLILIFILFSGLNLGYAQKERNNIYLFDCTGSMQQNGLWEPAKESLDATLNLDATIPGTQVTIIPFGDNPYGVFTFDAKDYSSKKNELFKTFNQKIKVAKYTHITDVLEEGLRHIDNNKDNRLFLLTDGQPNHGDSPEKVAETIRRWCATHKNTRLIYAALTKSAVDDKIRKALEECKDGYIVEVEGNIIPQFADISSNVYTNLEELESARDIEFSLPGSYNVKALNNDTLFNVKVEKNKAENGKIKITLSPKSPYTLQDLHQKLGGEDYEFPVEISTEDPKYKIVNPEVTVHVADGIPSSLTLAKGYDELKAEGVKWHDSFLWSPAAKDEMITWNLEPVFENELKNSTLRVKFTVPENKNDFEAYYNGSKIKNGDILTISPDSNALLEVQFKHDADTGKRYFELQPVGFTDLDMVNNAPVDEYVGTSLRTNYNVGWNPLAKWLFWIGIALIILLLLWLLLLQRIFFPKIKVGKIELKGPDSYYQSKRIKGARKVVLTSKKRKQNPLSKFFTGEVRYVKAEHFSPEMEIVPAAGKKKVKIRNTVNNPAWEIYPTTIFKQYDKGSLKNRTTNDETIIEFS